MQFIHGLEGSPRGTKGRYLARHFETRAPAMDTRDFEGCVTQQAEALAAFRPDVLVGSSFGGAVAVALLDRGLWRGPTLLLAQGSQHLGQAAPLPEGVTVWLVHGTKDALIDAEDSRALARTGSPDRVRVIEVDDDHALHQSVQNDRLRGWVQDVHRAAAERRGA